MKRVWKVMQCPKCRVMLVIHSFGVVTCPCGHNIDVPRLVVLPEDFDERA